MKKRPLFLILIILLVLGFWIFLVFNGSENVKTPEHSSLNKKEEILSLLSEKGFSIDSAVVLPDNQLKVILKTGTVIIFSLVKPAASQVASLQYVSENAKMRRDKEPKLIDLTTNKIHVSF